MKQFTGNIQNLPTGGPALFEATGEYFPQESFLYVPSQVPTSNSKAFLFQGQGNFQKAKYLHQLKQSTVLGKYVEDADRFCNRHNLQSVSDFFETKDEPCAAVVPMLALLTYSCGAAAQLIQRGIVPDACIGFSFGEMAALVTAGIVDFHAALELVRLRDACCGEPYVQGSLIFVAASKVSVESIIVGMDDIHLSNHCSLQKTVVAVKGDVKRWLRFFKGHGHACLPLKSVPYPYHTPWMEDASVQTKERICATPFSTSVANCHFIGSQTEWSGTQPRPNQNWLAEAVATPLRSVVDFPGQIKRSQELGIPLFVEIGSGVSAFIEDMNLEKRTKVFLADQHLGFSENKDILPAKTHPPHLSRSKLYHALLSSIAKYTGYQVESIQLEKRFQEDLGLDSIKKAQIIFSVIEEKNLEPSRNYQANEIQDVGDAVAFMESEGDPITSSIYDRFVTRGQHYKRWHMPWVICPLNTTDVDCEIEFVECKLTDFTSNGTEEISTALENAEGLLFIFSEEDLTQIGPDFNEVFATGWLRWHKCAWGSPGFRDIPIVIQVCLGVPHAVQGLMAFLHSISKEHNAFKYCLIETNHLPPHYEERKQLARIELSQGSGQAVLYRDGVRMQRKATPVDAHTVASDNTCLTQMVVIGATAGILETLLPAMIREGLGKELLLVGRRPEEDAQVQQLLERVTASNYEYLQSDVSIKGETLKVLEHAHAKWQNRRFCVLFAAGVEVSLPWLEMKWDQAESVLFTKLRPLLELMEHGHPLGAQKQIFFSSIASIIGNAGQAVYAYVNAMMDAASRVSQHDSKSISWLPWLEVGMAARPTVRGRLQDALIPMMHPKLAIQVFLEDLKCSHGGHHYYSDERDLWLLDPPPQEGSDTEELIGALLHGLYYTRHFGLDADPWLRDHEINGAYILPAAFMIQSALTYARMYLGEDACLMEFRVISPLVISSEGAHTTWRIRHFVAEQNQLEIFCASKSGEIWKTIARKASHHDEFHRSTPLRIPTEDMGSVYASGKLFHGPSFQVIENFYPSSMGPSIATIASEKRCITGDEQSDQMVRILEAGFQLVGLMAFEQYGIMSLPTGLGGFSSSGKLADVRFLTGENIQLKDQELTGQVWLWNETGTALAFMDRVTMRKNITDAG